ncbi:hypothetical protein [Edwardsiella tarda]|uniref:hypothetical protein n=1 Tax=Edwardsiella tarda TaxID=636 RepID=UPI00351C56BD
MLSVAGKHQHLLAERLLPLIAPQWRTEQGALAVAGEASGAAFTDGVAGVMFTLWWSAVGVMACALAGVCPSWLSARRFGVSKLIRVLPVSTVLIPGVVGRSWLAAAG